MKFEKSEIWWSDPKDGRPGEVAVVEQFDANGNQTREAQKAAERYSSSMGASCTYWKKADAKHLTWWFARLTCGGHDPKQVHQEFMKIDEYKRFITNAGLDDPAEFHELRSA